MTLFVALFVTLFVTPFVTLFVTLRLLLLLLQLLLLLLPLLLPLLSWVRAGRRGTCDRLFVFHAVSCGCNAQGDEAPAILA